jgi:alpha-tubulin suppressor-like RCC1 family protein
MKNILIVCLLFISLNKINAQCFNKISTSNWHVLAQKTDGSLWGWGLNSNSNLGNGDMNDQYSPIPILNSSNTQSFIANYGAIFVLKTNGSLWACGGNYHGELGIGGSASITYILTQLGSSTNWSKIASGDFFTIALKTDGTLWGWGQNDGSQMGNNTCCTDQTTPIQIGTATDWKEVAASKSRAAYAIKTNGTLWAWGSNINGMLGGSNISEWHVPTLLDNSTNWDKLFMGEGHCLLLKTDSTLWGLGDPSYGQRGYNGSNSIFPNQIAGTWKTAAAGFRFSMAIKTDGTLWGFGQNDNGQMANGTCCVNIFTPLQIGTATNWASVACGYNFVVALRTDGSLWSWGDNAYGQLGNGTTTATTTPTQVPVTGCALGTEAFAATDTLFVLSPNPATSELSLTYKSNENIDSISIYDLTGREIQTLPALGNNNFKTTFQISNLATGSYIIQLKNNNKTVAAKKFVKE